MKKQILVFLLVLVGIHEYAHAWDFTVNDIEYSVSDHAVSPEASLKKVPLSLSGDFTIPSEVSYDGKKYIVTCIEGGAFNGCNCLNSVTIPNSVTTISHTAFRQCGMTSVTIPNSVTYIGYSAFENCSSLTSVTIPKVQCAKRNILVEDVAVEHNLIGDMDMDRPVVKSVVNAIVNRGYEVLVLRNQYDVTEDDSDWEKFVGDMADMDVKVYLADAGGFVGGVYGE